MHVQPIDYIGIIGGAVLLFAFWRVSTGYWKATSAWYELDNFVAAILLIFYALNKHAYVSIVLNIVWALVAFHGFSSYTEQRIMRDPTFRRAYKRGQAYRSKTRA